MAAALTTRELTDQQRAFIEAYAFGETAGKGRESAIRAGYAEKHARQESYRLLHNDAVLAELDRVNRREIGNLATLSIRRLRQILEDDNAPHKMWLEASKTALDRAGIIAPKASEPERPANNKPMAQWTAAELDEFIARTREAIERAESKMIDVTPAEAEGGAALDAEARAHGQVEDTAAGSDSTAAEGPGGTGGPPAGGRSTADGGAAGEAGNDARTDG